MKATTVRDLGAHVRSARRAQGMTQAGLAERLNVSRDWVVRLEQGHPRLEAQRVLDALVVLGLNLDVTAPAAAPRRTGKPPEAVRAAKTARAKSGASTSKRPGAARASKNASPKKDPFDVVFRGR
ncbi:helix-turn-helix domain-containing protein [Nocardioides hungaricus]